jgi:hypothetical protein
MRSIQASAPKCDLQMRLGLHAGGCLLARPWASKRRRNEQRPPPVRVVLVWTARRSGDERERLPPLSPLRRSRPACCSSRGPVAAPASRGHAHRLRGATALREGRSAPRRDRGRRASASWKRGARTACTIAFAFSPAQSWLSPWRRGSRPQGRRAGDRSRGQAIARRQRPRALLRRLCDSPAQAGPRTKAVVRSPGRRRLDLGEGKSVGLGNWPASCLGNRHLLRGCGDATDGSGSGDLRDRSAVTVSGLLR